jgi:hypothetical protein
MKPITFSRVINKRTFIALSFSIMLQSKFAIVYYSIAALAIILFVTAYGFDNAFISYVVFGLTSLMLFFPFRALLLSSSRYKNAPSANEPILYTITDDGIEINGTNYITKLLWTGILKITENSKWVFMWYSKSRFVFFQKDLVTDEQLQEIKSTFRENRKRSLNQIP